MAVQGLLLPSCLLLLLLLLTLAANISYGGYLITTPKKCMRGEPQQVCVFVTDPAAPEGNLTVSLTSSDWNRQGVATLANTTFQILAGKTQSCFEVPVSNFSYHYGGLHVSGTVDGTKINQSSFLFLQNYLNRTYVQTDKFLYQPGQNVKLRILTLSGPDLRLSTEQYKEVWVRGPSLAGIAQWKNVDNSAGLVHLDFDLADEPEKGRYYISTRDAKGFMDCCVEFRVEDLVLPRFEVTLKPPSYILVTDETFTFTVCVNYTFGQPVKGNLTFTVNNKKSKKCRGEVTRNFLISSCRDVEVTAAEMHIISCYVHSLKATAIVTEEDTGVEIKAEKHVSIFRTGITFKTLYADNYLYPNLPSTLKLRAELPDGSPAAGVPMEVCAADRCANMTTAPDGILTTVLPSYKTNRVFMKALNCRATMDQSEFSMILKHYFSPSNSSLLIHAPEGKLKCVPGEAQEHVLPILFSATNQTSASITVQVMSRGKIQYWNTKKYQLISGDLPLNVEQLVEPLPPPPENTVRGVVNLRVNLPPTASPIAKVLVWYTREDGEVVSDMKELMVEKCLGYTVKLTWSTPQAQPGEQVLLSITSEPNSVCSVGVVDKDTELLAREERPFTLEKVFRYADRFTVDPLDTSGDESELYCREKLMKKRVEAITSPSSGTGSGTSFPTGGSFEYYNDYSDAKKMFDKMGLQVFTDLTVQTKPCEWLAAFPSDPDTYDRRRDKDDVAPPRPYLADTWLWDLAIIPPSGVRRQELTLPDTITQWVGKAVCVHPQKGMGMSEKEYITTLTHFFVDLTLPPTVKRGEILPVKMTIFNNLGQPIPVTVTVRESPEYEILEEPANQGPRGKRSSCVPAQDKVVQTVRIRPTVMGDVNITVTAFVDHQYPEACGSDHISINKRDALIKPIKVEDEGFLKEKTWTKYICSKDFETGDDSLEAWELETPSVLVEGSERGWVTVAGDLLALSLENLGHLIRMPSGGGEQNMINVSPNIFIMQYLTATNQTTPEATEKLLRFMNKGYQQQYVYGLRNGSFITFENTNEPWSIWLVAYVLKSFAQAKDFIPVDKYLVRNTSMALRWSKKKDDCFLSVDKVHHKGLKGGIAGSNTSVPLTAYVMISLLEAGEAPTSSPVSQAAQCLTADTSPDPYTLALKAYALSLGHHPEAGAVLQQLLGLAVVAKNSTHWELPMGPGKSKATEVETAGYAIMAMMTQDPLNFEQQARKVVKWVTAQMNGQGGFYSTQDTVVALQALALFESHLYQGPLNVVATVTATGLTHSFTVTEDNKLLQQLVTLPTLPTTVSINMEGQGCAVLQAVLRYNIHDPEPSEAFYLTVSTATVPDERCLTKRITVCTAYRLPDGQSNMALIQVDLISGYIPEKKDLKKLLTEDVDIKRYEVDGSLVTFYIKEITYNNTCLNFRVIREVNMEDVKAGTVTVYDYYQPEIAGSMRYTLPPPTECR